MEELGQTGDDLSGSILQAKLEDLAIFIGKVTCYKFHMYILINNASVY
jgi:hypothetical protein